MLASKHAVFAGPGRLPKELRDALLKRTGSAHTDLAGGPRLAGVFDNAVDAERTAASLQRLKIGALVAGPEQPPAEDAWFVVRSLEPFGGEWRLTIGNETRALRPADVSSVAVVEWRPPEGPADRGVLLRCSSFERPVHLRASTLDPSSTTTGPVEGLRRLNELLDDCALAMPPGARRVSRRLGPQDLAGLEEPLLPLALAVVDALDVHQAQLSMPLKGLRLPTDDEVPPRTVAARVTSIALLADGALLAVGFAAMGVVGGVAAVRSAELGYLAASVVVLAAAFVKLATGRWLSRYAFARPLEAIERIFRTGAGSRPRRTHLLVDAAALTTVAFVRGSLPSMTPIADLVLVALGLGLIPTLTALVVVGPD